MWRKSAAISQKITGAEFTTNDLLYAGNMLRTRANGHLIILNMIMFLGI